MFSRIRKPLRYAFQYIPFTWNTVVIALAIWFVHYYLFRQEIKPGEEETASSFVPFILLMGKMLFWFLICLLGLSILTTIASWTWYLYLRAKGTSTLQLQFSNEQKGKSGRQRLFINAALERVFRPMLGFVKGRLFYDDLQLTDKFPLLGNKRKEGSLLREGIGGKSRLLLPDIKEYQLKGGFVFFEDMLHLLSLPVQHNISGQFYQPPVLQKNDDPEVNPKKTETLDVRIDEMRRVEGELLNYKSFEAGDDVRRIVWKIYAKNRDLVVRNPEMFEPYASHLYFYASFHIALKHDTSDGFMKEMLNYYKNRVWTIFDTLSKKEWEMRYMPDQSFTLSESLSISQKAALIISASEWQHDHPLLGYFNSRQGAVLCVSSLVNPEELRQTLSQSGQGTVIYYVKLSTTFRHLVAFGWLKQIIFLPPKDRLEKLRRRWIFSPFRYQLRARERELEKVLETSGSVYTTL